MQEIQFKTNLNTNFLKIIACISMTIDHIGYVFFPQYRILRWIGRMAFPIFCYCLTVGMVYTRDIRKYFLRLGVFAIISQPFYVLALHPDAFLENIADFNILFTLFISLLAVWGFKEKKWLLFAFATLATVVVDLDYSSTGIILMMIFYLFRNKPVFGILFYILNYTPAFFNSTKENLCALIIGDYAIGFQIFALLAIPFVFIRSTSNMKISKWFFYAFYPMHLMVIYIFRFVLCT